MIYRAVVSVICIAAPGSPLVLGTISWKTHSTTEIHTFEYRLLLTSEASRDRYDLLPPGTALYHDRFFPEGFTRYKICINIDRVPLALTKLQDPTEIMPLEASAPTAADLQKLLHPYPLSLSDLQAILKSSRLSRQDIHSLLQEYSSP